MEWFGGLKKVKKWNGQNSVNKHMVNIFKSQPFIPPQNL